jgi:hypothetical protein
LEERKCVCVCERERTNRLHLLSEGRIQNPASIRSLQQDQPEISINKAVPIKQRDMEENLSRGRAAFETEGAGANDTDEDFEAASKLEGTPPPMLGPRRPAGADAAELGGGGGAALTDLREVSSAPSPLCFSSGSGFAGAACGRDRQALSNTTIRQL